jgi:hypothetical protein
MSKQSNNIKVSVADIIQLFQTAPEQAYKQLISSSHYFHTKQTKSFWDAYIQLDHDKLSKQFPNAVDTFNQVVWLKLFYDLNEFYKTERANNIEALITLNPDNTSFTKSLFICLELGETSSQQGNFPNYSEESLEAIKILLKEVLPLLTGENKTSYSLELAQLSNNLIKIQIDIALLAEFLDAFVWADFEMMIKESSKGFVLSLPDGKLKTENLFVLNHLKTFVKRDFKRKESHPKISEEEHFKMVDPKFKTDKGLATVYITGGTITSQTEGTTFIHVDENYFQDFNSDDPAKKEAATLKMLLDSQEQNFHYQYRNALSQIYQPNDEIDIHALHVEIEKNTLVTLYELLCAMSCIIARADAFRYMSDFPNSGSIKSIKRSVLDLINSQKPELSAQEKESMANSEIVHHFKMFDEHYEHKIFFFFTEENILSWFAKIEELKTKSQKELKAIINLFSSSDSPLPFNPIYKIDEQYYFSYTTCGKFNLNQLLYDNYISDKLFNPNRKPSNERPLIEETQKSREIRFTNSLKELFQTVTPLVEARLEFGDPNSNYDFGDLKGEFDVIAFFEKENIIFPIQVKLSNVSPRSEKRKEEWITNRITGKGIQQVAKDLKLLHSKSGLKFFADKLKTKSEIKAPLIYPLIVTDNFFADHLSFSYNEKEDYVFCISYIELKHLLLNQKVHDKQADWMPFENGSAAAQLIEAIETNSFWNFLNEFADNFTFSKTLSAINDEMKIEMKV